MPSLPYAVNQDPAPFAVNVPVHSPVEFDVVDFGEPGAIPEIVLSSIDGYFAREDLTAQVTGATAAFTTPQVFETGSLKVWLGGIRQRIVAQNGPAQTFSLDAPVPLGLSLEAEYVLEIHPTAPVVSSIHVILNGEVAFTAGAFEPGYAGTIEHIPGGYHLAITTHPDFDPGTAVTMYVSAQDRDGNTGVTEWTFRTPGISVFGISATEVEDDGGYPLTLTGHFTEVPALVELVNQDTSERYACYSHSSGDGYRPFPVADTQLTFATPVVPTGVYDIEVTQGADVASSTDAYTPFALTVRVRNWLSRTFALRRVFPPVLKVGPRTLDNVEPLS